MADRMLQARRERIAWALVALTWALTVASYGATALSPKNQCAFLCVSSFAAVGLAGGGILSTIPALLTAVRSKSAAAVGLAAWGGLLAMLAWASAFVAGFD